MAGYDGARAKSLVSRPEQRDNQRHWRLLISVGLLLPALAALIGIVAWAISVEVAGGHERPSSLQQRRHVNSYHHHSNNHHNHNHQQPQQPQQQHHQQQQQQPQQQQQAHKLSAHRLAAAKEAPADDATEQPAPVAPQLDQLESAKLAAPPQTSLLLTNVGQLDQPKRRLAHDETQSEPREQPADSQQASGTDHARAQSQTGELAASRLQAAAKLELAKPSKLQLLKSGGQPKKNAAKPKYDGDSYLVVKQSRPAEEPQPDADLAPPDDQQDDEPAKRRPKPAVGGPEQSQLADGPDEPEDERSVGFEAIASAISSTLSADSNKAKSQKRQDASAKSLEGDLGDDDQQQQQQRAPPKVQLQFGLGGGRRRTTGEHVAEVIDHIVERRQHQHSNQNQNQNQQQLASSSGQARSAPSQQIRGPQIVVVTPVGNQDGSLRARSLTKEQPAEPRATPRVPLLGARLLGTGEIDTRRSDSDAPKPKYSERVEVIQDEDAGALIGRGESAAPVAPVAQQSNEQLALLMMNPDSIHTTGKAKLRAPRHGDSPALAFERYAPLKEQPAAAAQSRSDEQQAQQPQQQKMYSAEQLIREHLLKSKVKSKLEATRAAGDIKKPGQQQQQSQHQAQLGNKPRQQVSRKQTPDGEIQQQQQQQVHNEPAPPSEPRAEAKPTAPLHTVRVPVIVAHQTHQADGDQLAAARPDTNNQPAESQRHEQVSPREQPTHQVQQQGLSQQHQHQHQHQHQVDSSLPSIPDQEFNVPAHLADSVIQDIQRSPSSYDIANGQQLAGLVQHQQRLHPNQHHQHQQQSYFAQQLQHQASHQVPFYSQQFAPQSRFVNFVGQPQPQQLQQQRQQGPRLAHRVAADAQSVSAAASEAAKTSVVPRGLFQPVAQLALQRLINSMGQQAMQQEYRRELADGQNPMARSAPSQDATPAAAAAVEQQVPIGGQLPQQVQQQLAAEPSGQEMQESASNQYHMPAYHMDGGPPPAHYGGQQYQEPDKKAKGITFHFGGGPIGGGTQLITSPMGIFKHLMLPLMPNPRVNLNGKVVFGVVLEKTTAFGAPPKKKHKFWG